MKAWFFVIVGLSILIPCQASTIYVKEGATGTGGSWTDAYGSLQDALVEGEGGAEIGDEIWVAAGTYKPTSDHGLGIGDRGKHFRMMLGVAIYGGFAGTETELNQRDVQNNETILSGDLLGNDNPATPVEDLLSDPTRADNCYQVFYHMSGWVDATAVLDGFTISGGNANGSWPHGSGGGMYNGDSSPTVINCIFSRNSAAIFGGGMSNGNSSPTVTDCTFSGNSANDFGGGIANRGDGSPIVMNCSFTGNSAGVGGGMSNHDSWDSGLTVTDCAFSDNSAMYGGGIYNMASYPTVTNCTFSNNSATRYGGGIHDIISNPVMTNCTFSGNTADNGGGIYNEDSSPAVSECTFSDNSASGNGGGIYNWFNCTPTVSNCTFSGNSANNGGGMYNDIGNWTDENLTVTDSTFSENIAVANGGGVYNYNCETTFRSCAFTGNSATDFGGGMYIESDSDSTVTICTFSGNSAYFGGGIYGRVDNSIASQAITDCTFSSNSAIFGGGMHLEVFGDLIVSNCLFSGNSADNGGGVYNMMGGFSGRTHTFSSCTFGGNSAENYGGGIYFDFPGDLTVVNCLFNGNSADNGGGGMYSMGSYPDSNQTVTNCTLSSNSADNGGGGGMYNHECDLTVSNCIIWGNTALYNNAIYNESSSPVIGYSNIFDNYFDEEWDASQGTDGGGNIEVDPMFVRNPDGGGDGWGDDPDTVGVDEGANDDYGDLHLQAGSPCINAGDDSVVTVATDLDGHPRVSGAAVDMGAYERFEANTAPVADSGDDEVVIDLDDDGIEEVTLDGSGSADSDGDIVSWVWTDDLGDAIPDGEIVTADLSVGVHTITLTVTDDDGLTDSDTVVVTVRPQAMTWYVDDDATGSNSGFSWENAFTELQSGLDAAIAGDQIWVAGGTYLPDTTGLGDAREASFALVNGVTVKGGHAGFGAANPDERNIELNETILSGDLNGDDDSVMLFGGDDPFTVWYSDPNRIENCYHVFYHPDGLGLDPNAVLDGFTVTGGNAFGPFLSQYSYGGGMYNDGSSPTITNCIFSSNLARDGAGIYNDNSSPTVTKCIFSDNLGLGVAGAGGSGGGICNDNNSNPTVSDSIFSDNSAARGGGICNYNSSPIVINCTFSGNSAYNGGGMYNELGSPKVTNCTFSSNSANMFGFIGYGGGMCNSGGNPVVTNCILWGNTALSGGNEIALWGPSAIDVDHCDVQGGEAGIYDDGTGNTINWGGDNIDIAPMFIDAEGGDLRLMSSSPCIDAGDDSVVTVATDLDGNPRVMGAAVDMGAYEFVSLPPVEAVAYVFPRVLNAASRGRYVIARMQLPDGVSKDDVADDSLVLIIGDTVIESIRQRRISSRGQDYVFGFFDRGRVIAQADGKTKLDIVIAGELTTGQCIYGEDSIKIVKSQASQKKTSRRMPARNNRGGRGSRGRK